MDPAPIRRWNPGFIALRWRHLFWALPLAGLLIGMIVHLVDYQKKNVSTSLVQLDPPPFSSFGFSELINLIRSDDILEATSQEVELPARWRTDRVQSVDALRRIVSCEQIPGTSLVAITIKGRKSPETVELCTALTRQVEKAVELFASKEDDKVSERFAKKMDRVRAREKIAREMLDKMTKESGSMKHSRSWADAEFYDARQELNEAKKDLHDWSLSAMSGSRRPGFEYYNGRLVIVHELPSMASPSLRWKFQEAALGCGVNIGSGMLLAVVLAYLLELLFPRRSPTM